MEFLQRLRFCILHNRSFSRILGRLSSRGTRSMMHVCFLALLALVASAAHGQVTGLAQIQGTVVDATGALVANATVTLTNTAMQQTRTSVTDSAGTYLFPNIPVATYNLKVSAPGFQTYSRTGIVLEVGSSISINVTMTVGRTDQHIEVQASGLALQTEDSSFKQTIDHQTMTEMPLNGRQMTALITLSGGSSPAPSGDFTGSKYSYQTVAVSVAGGMGNTTEWKLDGGDNNDYMGNGNLPFPFPDAVSQFSVESTVLGAQSGSQHSGGLVNVITRSGTNAYHGSAFEFIRNNYINATNFFATSKDTLHQNQFGGTFGGPILKDKLFAFAGYQRTVAKQATSNVSMYIPTAANLAGDWSITDPPPGSPANTCGAPQQLYDPITGAAIPGNKYATAPSYNAQALALYKYLPKINPAVDTANCGRVSFAVPSQVFDNQFVTRVDYNINQKHNLYARYLIDGYQAPSFYSPTNILITYLAPGNYERVQTATIGENWIISPRLVNSLHISGSKRVDLRQSAPGINANNIGVDISTTEPTGLQISVSTAGKNHAWSAYCGTCAPGHFNVNSEGISDDVTYINGKHQLVFGGEYVRAQFNQIQAYESNGVFTFNGQYSGSGPSGGNILGDSNLDFLMGSMSGFAQSKQQQIFLSAPFPSLYVQETYHASKRLTLVAGIRWAPEFMPVEKINRGANFDAASFQANKVSSVFPNAPAGVFYYGDPGVSRAYTKASPWQFNPNFGASWDPFGDGNTVVRGGLQVAYDAANLFTAAHMNINAPFDTASSPNTGAQLCFSTPWLVGGVGVGCSQVGGTNISPYPQPIIPTPAQAVFPAQSSWTFLPTKFHVADSLQWTFSIQHLFSRGWQAQIDYIGSKTSNMPIGTPISPAIYTPGVWGPGGTGCGGVVTTGPAAHAAGTPGAVGTPCSTTKNQQARFALTEANPSQGNQILGGSGSYLVNNLAWANYNGVVVSLQHRLSSTFSMMSNFTWSKCLNIADASGDVGGVTEENPYNLHMDYGRCGSDYERIFNTAIVAKSSFPLHGIAKLIANDWELAPLFHILSGAPFNITQGSDESLTAIGNDRPNRVPGTPAVKWVKMRSGPGEANRGYLNQAGFTLNTVPGTYGNLGRNVVSGPMTFQFDSQISRIFPIREKVSLVFRLEAFNVLNHPSFSNPSASNPSSGNFGQISGTSIGARIFQGSFKVAF
ncbi:carboxypeptidase-like regulatory domain-containing protein [Edaphobacter sp.]|uniref:carboxypeptidase-like regulatory domain-containing protein n=1 Tax=Edaphobacter sp. TaxID=1934404 RepID=UPI002DB9D544|nr:carboxypeptidase-like regulatory domain-containing protein [Edaphobacter sp.]HEU5339885.1 carboxypeptidase-like regulatory domain-containing protein [Edaphobacter sp.]